MKELRFIEEPSEKKMTGVHIYSICDIRHKKAKQLESDIEKTINGYRKATGRAVRDFYIAKVKNDQSLAKDLRGAILELRRRWHEEVTQMYSALRHLTLIRQETIYNILPTAGRTVVAEWLTGTNTSDAANGANYGSLGDNATAVANGDTALTNETYRKATSSATNSSNVAYLSNFYTATEVTGTFEEAGWHIDGTASADTGDLLSHFLTGSITKSSVEALVIESQISVV